MPEPERDPEVCLCFHVHRRKLINWIRIERPRRAAQLSECFGAGTGCGWCRAYLDQLFAAAEAGEPFPDLPDSETYANQRADYLRRKKRTSDGAGPSS